MVYYLKNGHTIIKKKVVKILKVLFIIMEISMTKENKSINSKKSQEVNGWFKSIFFLFFYIFIFNSCDPAMTSKFLIRNDSPDEIYVKYSTELFSDSIKVVTPDSTILLYQERTLGIPHELGPMQFREIIQSFSLFKGDSLIYYTSVPDMTKWQYNEESKKHFFFGKTGNMSYTFILNQ
jgi:hypothetical protein